MKLFNSDLLMGEFLTVTKVSQTLMPKGPKGCSCTLTYQAAILINGTKLEVTMKTAIFKTEFCRYYLFFFSSSHLVFNFGFHMGKVAPMTRMMARRVSRIMNHKMACSVIKTGRKNKQKHYTTTNNVECFAAF